MALRDFVTVLTLPVIVVLVPSRPAEAQQRIEPGAPADSVAAAFQDALRAGAWNAVAALTHTEELERFRRVLAMVTEVDTTGATLERLLPKTGAPDLATLPPEVLFVRAAGTLGEAMPGIAHSLAAREVRVLGTVAEPPDRAHVVYRNRDLLAGAVPQVRVMILRRNEGEWRVAASDELDLIREAIRGLAR